MMLLDPYRFGVKDPNFSSVSLLLPGTGANNSTVFTDRSPTPKTLTAFGDAKITTSVADPFGNSNGVMTLDGSGDYATTPADAALALSGIFTVELFYLIGTVPGSYYMLLADEGTGSEYIAIKGNGYEIQFGATAATICNGSVTISTNSWNYLAITRNASNVIALRHNTTTVSLSNSTQSSQLFGNGTAFHVGAWNPSGTPGLFFSGQLSNIRITKGVLRDVSTVPTSPFPTQ